MPEQDQSAHIIVSGGSKGLGQSLVTGLLNKGYKVSCFSRNSSSFTNTHPSDKFMFAELDVADRNATGDFVENACSHFGHPFGLINCAGIARDGVLAAMKYDDIDQLIDVNLKGSLFLTRHVLRQMLTSRTGGAIINISSIIGSRGYSGLAAYAATKAGLDGATRALAREVGARGIRVNSIAPGYLDTEMTDGLTAEQKTQIIRRTPLARLGQSEDVTGAALFLLSDEARFITGQCLVVDGGITC